MATAAIVASTALTAYGQHKAGQAQNDAARSEASQMAENARRRLEEGRMRADEERRMGRIEMSDTQAAQAASGFATSGPGALKQRSDIAGARRFNELSYLYEASLDAEGLRRGAEARRREGRAAKRTANIGALSTAIRGGYDAYGSYNASKKETG